MFVVGVFISNPASEVDHFGSELVAGLGLAFLEPTKEFIILSFKVDQVIDGQVPALLFKLALNFVPRALKRNLSITGNET